MLSHGNSFVFSSSKQSLKNNSLRRIDLNDFYEIAIPHPQMSIYYKITYGFLSFIEQLNKMIKIFLSAKDFVNAMLYYKTEDWIGIIKSYRLWIHCVYGFTVIVTTTANIDSNCSFSRLLGPEWWKRMLI